MQHKLKQFLFRYKYTISNRLPSQYSRKYLFNNLRYFRSMYSLGHVKAALGLLRWRAVKFYVSKNNVAYRAGCLLTGRNRGMSKRFSIARVRIKQLANEGKLFGAKKSSW